MLRQVMKTITMPEVFWWKIPVWDPATRTMVMKDHPFLMPHEMFHHIVSKNKNWIPVDGSLYPELYEMLKTFCLKHELDMTTTTAVGLHGDGVPNTKNIQ